MIGEIIAAMIGTVAFALLFGVPKQYFLLCGFIGGAGWCLYSVLTKFCGCSATEATFLATVLVILLSRFSAVRMRCPVTVFLIAGIFPLVPGAGVYWTSYYLVMGLTQDALTSGFAAVKAAVAIVFGIVIVLELPNKIFHLKKRSA